jgi:hypothetical protein
MAFLQKNTILFFSLFLSGNVLAMFNQTSNLMRRGLPVVLVSPQVGSGNLQSLCSLMQECSYSTHTAGDSKLLDELKKRKARLSCEEIRLRTLYNNARSECVALSMVGLIFFMESRYAGEEHVLLYPTLLTLCGYKAWRSFQQKKKLDDRIEGLTKINKNIDMLVQESDDKD